MGVYLSEPETSKNVHAGEEGKLRFVSAEMQGISVMMQGGGRTWRMLLFINSTSAMVIHSLLCLMVMEVMSSLFRNLSQHFCE